MRTFGAFGLPAHNGLSTRVSVFNPISIGDIALRADNSRLAIVAYSDTQSSISPVSLSLSTAHGFQIGPGWGGLQQLLNVKWEDYGPIVQEEWIFTFATGAADVVIIETVDTSDLEKSVGWKSPGKIVNSGHLRQPAEFSSRLKDMAAARTKITINDWFDSLRNRREHGIGTRKHRNQL